MLLAAEFGTGQVLWSMPHRRQAERRRVRDSEVQDHQRLIINA
jgi:hypothetical protein